MKQSLTLSVDMSQMRGGLDRLFAAYDGWPPEKQEDFAARYRALSGAGAEWAEVVLGKDAVSAVLSDDMRQLCAEFGLTL